MSEFIEVTGARTHNLKNLSVRIPKDALTVVTGVSGSGKSSLAFDTIYAEGQRKYLESLSTYARMIAAGMSEDTEVDEIRGLSPTISISQKTVSSNPRSTVGTITEIYDYYRLLYTTIGRQYCPNHPDVELRKHTLDEVVEYVRTLSDGSRFAVFAPIGQTQTSSHEQARRVILDLGYVRYFDGSEIVSVSDERTGPLVTPSDFSVVVDRLVHRIEEDMAPFVTRLKESLEISYRLADEQLVIREIDSGVSRRFSRRATCPECGYSLQSLTLSNFSFNSHHGACPSCHGLGVEIAFREEDIINPDLTLAEGAVLPWTNYLYYLSVLEAACRANKIPLDVPYRDLSPAQRKIVLYGSDKELTVKFSEDSRHKTADREYRTRYEGVVNNMLRRYHEGGDREDSVYSKRIAQYMTEVPCATCSGHRLKPEMLAIRVGGYNIWELADLSVGSSLGFFRALALTPNEKIISKKILKNIVDRLEFLDGVGLDYMTISRRTATLSGGESQRIRLATQIGTKLEGIIYVLDEPSIGLHPMDNHRLITNIRKLVDIGNTVIVVEHDEDIMRAADYVVDVGPGAGVHGGNLVFSGTPDELMAHPETETGGYLSGRLRVSRPDRTFASKERLSIKNATGNNLKHVSVDIPLGQMTVVTGVSGSGKSTLVLDTLANAALNHFNGSNHPVSPIEKIVGFQCLDKAIIIDQSPIGKTPHSNVATYTGLFTHVREVFASTNEAQKRGYGPGRFSFNTKWGRCEVCEGSGVKKIEMHFLPDVYVTCEACRGTRYNRETLEVKFKWKTVADVLAMTIEEGLEFFQAFPRIRRVLQVLSDVGLGYIALGQSAPTFSGGEAQRVKLAFDLAKVSTSKTLYILDEPTTGLHFSDVQKLLDILHSLVERGNTVIVIEHNLDIIAHADHIIDIGPKWGDEGGELIYAGDVAGCAKNKKSATGEALRGYLGRFK